MACKMPEDHEYGLLSMPPHVLRLKNSLNLHPFLNYVEDILNTPLENVSEESSDDAENTAPISAAENCDDHKIIGGVSVSKTDRKADKSRLYNFSKTKKNRRWLKNLLCSESSSDEDDVEVTDDRLQRILSMHQFESRHHRKFHMKNNQYYKYMYYSVGMLSNVDRHPQHYKLHDSPKKRASKEQKRLQKCILAELKRMKKKQAAADEDNSDGNLDDDDDGNESGEVEAHILDAIIEQQKQYKRSAKLKKLTPEQAIAKRKKLFVSIAKKEIPKAHKQKASARKDILALLKKVSHQCMKERRRAALQSQKLERDAAQRAKRLAREMLAYWKRFEKVEKEHRKKAQKEAQEQHKMDVELMEARRQQRKLNFLITQTELYAHFMARKLTGETDSDRNRILSRLEDDGCTRDGGVTHNLSIVDNYDSEEMKRKALRNAEVAYAEHRMKKDVFSHEMATSLNDMSFANPSISTEAERAQPDMFHGKLKSYQLKGMNWLVNLYDQGINGILADEMGLGKTVQTISLLAHLAENYNIWGPFLIVAPASTLHNWQQECQRFVPRFRAVPYWGNSQDRRILRKFWSSRGECAEESSFHLAITSYQLVIQDVKYFQRIKWQYMVLDEAQAIKSSASVRWKILLDFNCRNRLLLTGTPIQNSMAELWALLHFIMPTLFDSHQEFDEWFSKDIETSVVEKQSSIDEHQLSRLHMILKPFMLRRVKKDVENELSDKIEILVSCPLTIRQKKLYQAIRNKISIDDLLHSSTASTSQAQNTTSSLMNIVMMFRKVCNHPDLCERKDQLSPLFMQPLLYYIPKLIFREGMLSSSLPSKRHIFTTFSLFSAASVHSSLFHSDTPVIDSLVSFIRFINLSPSELQSIMKCGLIVRWLYVKAWLKSASRIYHTAQWENAHSTNGYLHRDGLRLHPLHPLSVPNVRSSTVLRSLLFTSYTSTFLHHEPATVHYMPETCIHHSMRERVMRQRQQGASETSPKAENGDNVFSLPHHRHKLRSPRTFTCQPTHSPLFLYYSIPPAHCPRHDTYTVDRSAQSLSMRYRQDISKALLQDFHGHKTSDTFLYRERERFMASRPHCGYSNIYVPDKESSITDAGKLKVLDKLLERLKTEGHRVLIYSQMTRMIDILEEYMWHRKHTYMRLDGSSKISDRRDMVADFQARSDIFVFLLSTRAGGLGINLTAADTVIFYDSDWNPTVDQQAMDRAHRLGQTKQVTVYRLVCKNSIEERMLQRAEEKSQIQRMVMSGGNFRTDTLKPKEVVSLLIDDEHMRKKLLARQEEKRLKEESQKEKERKRKLIKHADKPPAKRGRKPGWKKAGAREQNVTITAALVDTDSMPSIDSLSRPASPHSECLSVSSDRNSIAGDESSNDIPLIIDDAHSLFQTVIPTKTPVTPKRGRVRGRPRGPSIAVVRTSEMPKRQRGRGSVRKALSAAEIAGAQAGLTAAYAQFGYNYTGPKGTNNETPPQSISGSETSPVPFMSSTHI